jgi:hypothetical protein
VVQDAVDVVEDVPLADGGIVERKRYASGGKAQCTTGIADRGYPVRYLDRTRYPRFGRQTPQNRSPAQILSSPLNPPFPSKLLIQTGI